MQPRVQNAERSDLVRLRSKPHGQVVAAATAHFRQLAGQVAGAAPDGHAIPRSACQWQFELPRVCWQLCVFVSGSKGDMRWDSAVVEGWQTGAEMQSTSGDP